MAPGKSTNIKLAEQIIKQFKNGTSGPSIAKNLGLPKTTVYDIHKKFIQTGTLNPKPKSGRISVVKPRDTRVLRKL